MSEQDFWIYTHRRASSLAMTMGDLMAVWPFYNYPLDGPARRDLERVRKQIDTILAEDDERERQRNVA